MNLIVCCKMNDLSIFCSPNARRQNQTRTLPTFLHNCFFRFTFHSCPHFYLRFVRTNQNNPVITAQPRRSWGCSQNVDFMFDTITQKTENISPKNSTIHQAMSRQKCHGLCFCGTTKCLKNNLLHAQRQQFSCAQQFRSPNCGYFFFVRFISLSRIFLLWAFLFNSSSSRFMSSRSSIKPSFALQRENCKGAKRKFTKEWKNRSQNFQFLAGKQKVAQKSHFAVWGWHVGEPWQQRHQNNHKPRKDVDTSTVHQVYHFLAARWKH